jgi:3',5'-cyclic-AMP phosphodiesterase
VTPANVLQLTDLHLFADEHGTMNQVPTRNTFVEVLDACRATGLVFEQVVFTGDLAQDESLEAYRCIRDLVTEWVAPSRIQLIPGNHDSRRFIREAFPESTPAGGEEDPITFSVAAGAWRLIGVDTLIPGESAGIVDEAQLDWLRRELASHEGAPTLVFMHHPPVPGLRGEWLERMGLRNQDAVLDILRAAPQVRAVSSGHLHHELCIHAGAFEVLVAPSTAYQYARRDGSVVLDPLPPGFRTFTLRDERYETTVGRVNKLNYPAR